MKKFLGLIAVLGLAASLLIGCKHTLQPGGAYAPITVTTNTAGVVVTNATALPDLTFYEVDAAFSMAYAALDGVFTWERDNRAVLWSISPQIKKTLDGIRPTAAQIVKDYAVARAAYKANPTPAGLATLQTILAKAQQLQAAAAAVSANLNTPK